MRNIVQYSFLFWLLVIFSSCARKQSVAAHHQDCNCSKYPLSNEIKYINTSNNNSILLCAIVDDQLNTPAYKILNISNCTNNDSIILSSNNSYNYQFYKDTLELFPLIDLPLGFNYKYQLSSIFIEKISYNSDNHLQKIKIKNPNFPKYTKSQMLDVLEEYHLKYYSTDKEISLLLDKLLVAAISGNSLAITNFKNFEIKYKAMNEFQKNRYERNKRLLIDFILR